MRQNGWLPAGYLPGHPAVRPAQLVRSLHPHRCRPQGGRRGQRRPRAWILLLEAGADAEALLLQAKQAGPSVLADYAGDSDYTNQGERVVAGQRLMQASSDIFLGWLRAHPTGNRDEDYYLRQLRDWTLSAEIEQMSPDSMNIYARLCGWTLARGPRPRRRPNRHRRLPRQLGHVRERDRRLRPNLRRPERTRPRNPRRRRHRRTRTRPNRDMNPNPRTRPDRNPTAGYGEGTLP